MIRALSRSLLTGLALLLAVAACDADAPAEAEPPAGDAAAAPVLLGERHVLHSQLLGEDRVVSMWAPPGEAGADPTTPILYLTDGDWNYEMAVGVVRTLMRGGDVPPLRVVAVHHPDRGVDMTPWPDPRSTRPAKAEVFLKHLVEEVIPFAEGPDGDPSMRLLLGHSLGGIFDVYALLERPEAFDVYIAVAGALSWGEGRLFTEAAARLPKLPAGDRMLILTSASGDGAMSVEDHQRLLQVIAAADPPGLKVSYAQLEGESHFSALPRSLVSGLKAAFPLIRPDEAFGAAAAQGVEALARWHAAQRAALGERAQLRENTLNIAGYGFHADGKAAEAVAVFTYMTQLYPQSSNAWDSLGEGLELAGDKKGARDAYARAVKIGADTGDHPENQAVYEAHLKAAEAALKP